MIPGQIIPAPEPVEPYAPAEPIELTVTNTGDVPVHITAHFHVMEANPRLRFDRARAFGMRLHTHAKGAVRFEPGETKTIQAVPIGGARRVYGFNGIIDGPLADTTPEEALKKLIERGFLHQPVGEEDEEAN
jgi:urease beta subunit